ncbi:nuclear transport factor 2 family protein [Pseudonocardia spinosispora]|uniref:nuclear transport factor 2 family protein n=1 Tax=Pseudonocardia spinosispora TaxID=103441 RepID=UPI0003FF41FC|nr:nuclear transport factor 2 family protein [Pseudonocardia spinosispora]
MSENRAVVDRALELLLAKDMAGFVELWEPDGVMEFPFAAPGFPTRLVGHAQLHDYLDDYPQHVDLHAIVDLEVHQSVDPSVVIVEFGAEGLVVPSGRPYRLRYIAVLTIRDGRIARYRDYWSPRAVADALGAEQAATAFGAP